MQVAFYFASGIETPLANHLEKLGLEVRGWRVGKSEGSDNEDSCGSDFGSSLDLDESSYETQENFSEAEQYPSISSAVDEDSR